MKIPAKRTEVIDLGELQEEWRGVTVTLCTKLSFDALMGLFSFGEKLGSFSAENAKMDESDVDVILASIVTDTNAETDHTLSVVELLSELDGVVKFMLLRRAESFFTNSPALTPERSEDTSVIGQPIVEIQEVQGKPRKRRSSSTSGNSGT